MNEGEQPTDQTSGVMKDPWNALILYPLKTSIYFSGWS